jgi:hypothetical protein
VPADRADWRIAGDADLVIEPFTPVSAAEADDVTGSCIT